MDVIGGVFLVAGALFILLAGVGVVRFDDIYARMHAAAKGPALGVLLIGVGTILSIRSVQAVVAVLLVVALQFVTGPVGTHMLGRSVYRRLRPPLSDTDELADAERERPS